MDASSIALLDSVVEDASVALFASIGLSLSREADSAKSPDDMGASIGFAGPELRGALVLISTRKLVRLALPREVQDRSSDEQLADWMGELANQLLGRIKNKLIAYGVNLAMGTPAVMLGLDLARKDRHRGVRRQFSFRHAEEALSVYLDAVAPAEFKLKVPSVPPVGGIVEGDVAFF
ncbi:MAG TPA: chemotaxis protein CheX [Polyangiaceae bacterium]